MATIIKHPDVEDYFVELTLEDIKGRSGGITDLYEASRLIVLKDYRLPVDLSVFGRLSSNIAKVDSVPLRRTLKKLTSSKFFEGVTAYGAFAGSDPVQRAVFDVLCNGDPELFALASRTMKAAHDTALELFQICFPTYDYFRIIPSVRFTTTLFENIHWDNHSINDDFHQVRIFCNLDQRPRIWHTSHNFVSYASELYREHELNRFAGKDPNELVNYMCGDVLGGTRNACRDSLPRHVIAFDPGEVWFGESRMIAHQIFYGERAMVYMFLVRPEGMSSPTGRFNEQVEALHASMA